MTHEKEELKLKKSILSILIIAITIMFFHPLYAGIRCKNDLISIGDAPSEVRIKLSKCGKVLDKEVVRKETTIENDDNRTVDKIKKEKLIEIWYIRVEECGSMYCYPLSFEEGRLKNIGRWSRCD